ncbi:UDP-glucose 6-dehydrogenase [Lachnellula occidentalis]|uniref:UDP-glucose 6-dehydrogenase n=1 Tax=Lachnellula occidentalis TaxID=215460 RepID=A0A8H8UDH1_9HELO|nr:UDP-glucose 6-dehydrogenase [Lachnellula occidentalis]
MARHLPQSHLAVKSKDNLLDIPTASTTKCNSLSFSPSFPALELEITLEDKAMCEGRSRQSTTSLDALLSNQPEVRDICCIGAGYVGGTTSAMMAFQNPHLKITVVDQDPIRIQKWNSKHLPILEPGLQDILRIARDGSNATTFFNEAVRTDFIDSMSSATFASSEYKTQGSEQKEQIFVQARQPNLFFSTDVSRAISDADIVLIAVDTPTKLRGFGAGRAADMTALEAVSREVATYARPGAIIVEKSTVPCRTAEMIRDTLRIHRPSLDFEVLSNPEFLAEGTAMTDLLNPSRVVIGCSQTPAGYRAADALASVYAPWVPQSRIVTMNIWSSELSKLVANAMLAQRISSINSISAICEATGADIDDVARSIGLDPRIGDKFLKSGVGFGGSCFKKDVLSLTYLAEGLGLPEVAGYWTQVLTVNDWQRARFVRRVIECLNGTLVGKKLTVLGYAFKKNTGDTRESPALECIKVLLDDTPKEIAVFDSCCDPEIVKEEIGRLLGDAVLRDSGGPVEVYSDAYRACLNSHAVLILTDCDEFQNSAPSKFPNVLPEAELSAPMDPRPFQRLEPTESQILSLQMYLSAMFSVHDPLQRFVAQPECEAGCQYCLEQDVVSPDRKEEKNDRLDWARIAYHLQEPKWVFDGRGVLNISAMEALGVRVEAIGKVDWARRRSTLGD